MLLTSPTSLYLSISTLRFSSAFGWERPLPWKDGIIPILEDKTPPSRAYKKIEEIFALLNCPAVENIFKENSTIVELGSAPGGITKKLLDRGHKVISVDRAPLSQSLTNHPNLIQHHIADGGTFF